ncbi:hypothetical protein GQ55_7G216300 [Panicum hallii var. hallii]|uniref:DUF1618 domain-containing protein n=1 Tax=Panicum hallii var. hallii TaxID=1504633 RepID=A0A2T7CXJ8_9POAL|nr:hypothetical protein GQ55_7G216300 [Panicum hallii var. hallii]
MAIGLTLYARLLTPPELTTALYIGVNDDALRGMKAEFGLGSGDPLIQIDEFRGFAASAYVLATDERFIFFSLVFGLRERGERNYYLVYDAVAASLSMIPYLPPECSVAYTVAPLQMIRGGVCELAILACRPVALTQDQMERRKEDVVCVWPQAAAAWKVLGRNFPEQSIWNLFNADVMFSYGRKAFWVDLEQGLVHCDWPPADGAAVDFGFIGLPPGCPPDERWTKPTDRTMACVNGSIRFVWIDRSCPLGNVNISVWDLDPATKQWTKYRNFLAKVLWRLWSFKVGNLPEMEPRFPILMADGSLCLLIHNILLVGTPQPISCLWHPVILPFDFFKLLNPLTPPQRNLRGIFTQ